MSRKSKSKNKKSDGMSLFFDAIKEKRNGEIQSVKSKGYKCSPNYKFFDTFSVISHKLGFSMRFALFSANGESWFLALREERLEEEKRIRRLTTYYSILELFDAIIKNPLGRKACREFGSISSFNSIDLIHDNVIYPIDFPAFPERLLKAIIKRDVDLLELLVLLSLIQNKSNTYFNKTEEYKNGIYRFLFVYAYCKRDYPCLEKRDWHFDKDSGKYVNNEQFSAFAIVVRFKGRGARQDLDEFADKLKAVADKKGAIAKIYVERYNRENKVSINWRKIQDAKAFLVDSSTLTPREQEKMRHLKKYVSSSTGYFTRKGFSVGVNEFESILLINKFNKKYYLTEAELNEIIG